MRIGIYCRKSSGVKEDNISIKIQRENGIKFCKKNDFEYIVYEEIVSGGSMDRIEYNKMIDKCKKGELKGVWVFKYDRMERNMESMLKFQNSCIKYNLEFWVGDEYYNLRDKNSRLNVNFRSVIGVWERENIEERNRIGKINKLENGIDCIGQVGFGYKRENEKIIVDEVEGVWVGRIFKTFLYKNCSGYRDCFLKLQNKYKDKLYKGVTESMVVKVLNREDYLGERVVEYDNREWKTKIERLVEDDVWEMVREKIEYIKGLRKGNTIESYILKGMVNCDNCGKNMWVVGPEFKLKSGKRVRYKYYVCKNNIKNRRKKVDKRKSKELIICKSYNDNRISVNILENVIWDSLFDVLLNSKKIINEYKEKYSEERYKEKELKGKIKIYEIKLEKDKNDLLKKIDMVIDSGLDDLKEDIITKYKIEEKRVKNRIKECKRLLNNLKIIINEKDIIEKLRLEYKEIYKDNSFKNRKNLINKYVKEVYVKRLVDNDNGNSFEIKVGFKIDGLLDGNLEGNKIKKEDKNLVYISKFGVTEFGDLMYKQSVNLKIIFFIKIDHKNVIQYLKYNIII